MENNNQFKRISHSQFMIDGMNALCNYEDIKIPKRATKFSAGYDFYAPFDIEICPGHSFKFPTGIRVSLDTDKTLQIYPRSSLGFKYKLKIDNTVGIIDADYYNSDNEGHIWCSMTNMSSDKIVKIKKGEAFAQGIIVQYFITKDDEVTTNRNGGIGSTNK